MYGSGLTFKMVKKFVFWEYINAKLFFDVSTALPGEVFNEFRFTIRLRFFKRKNDEWLSCEIGFVYVL